LAVQYSDSSGLPYSAHAHDRPAIFVALFIWPADDAKELVHEHPDMSPDHPHLQEYQAQGNRHSHVFVIDDEHRAWPTHG